MEGVDWEVKSGPAPTLPSGRQLSILLGMRTGMAQPPEPIPTAGRAENPLTVNELPATRQPAMLIPRWLWLVSALALLVLSVVTVTKELRERRAAEERRMRVFGEAVRQ